MYLKDGLAARWSRFVTESWCLFVGKLEYAGKILLKKNKHAVGRAATRQGQHVGTTGLPVVRDPHDGCRGCEVAAVRGPQGGGGEWAARP